MEKPHFMGLAKSPPKEGCAWPFQKTPPPLCIDSSTMLLVDKNTGNSYLLPNMLVSVRAHKDLTYECSKLRGHLPWKCSERRPSSPLQPRFFIAMSFCRPIWLWSTRCHKHQLQIFRVPTKNTPQNLQR